MLVLLGPQPVVFRQLAGIDRTFDRIEAHRDSIDATFDLTVGVEAMSLPARITLVLERRGDRWLVVQGHFSLAAAGQDEGESFPTS